MKMRRAHITLVLIYCVCFAAGAWWLCQWSKFRGVEKWPSVEAVILNERGSSVPYRIDRWDGTHTGTTTSYAVEFQYIVDGRTYRGDLGSPDGKAPRKACRVDLGSPDGKVLSFVPYVPQTAFYKPGSPEVAVLDPAPFRGTGYLMTFLASGIIVGMHLCFVLAEQLCFFRLRRAVKRSVHERRAVEKNHCPRL